jgi:ABC-type uncharacterized transport system permease subunit
MSDTQKLRSNSLFYFFLSLLFRFSYFGIFLFVKGLSGTQHVVLHLLLALASLIMGFLALRIYNKTVTRGTNAGCLYHILLLLNIVGGIGAVFFALVHLFHQQGSDGEIMLWIF